MIILEKITQYIKKHFLLKADNTIIIGLSGGPDSVFLLHILIALQPTYNLTLIAAHLNHEWRTEADAEEEMCCALAQQHNIPFISQKLSALKSTQKYNGSKEEFARRMRRQFLEHVAHKYNAQSIALGHHAQDQQETFFIRLIRGTSLTGLIGMQPRHGLYIRPLLETNKSDILDWLKTHTIGYAIDSSNESDDYLRNRIRKNVLPAIVTCDNRWDKNFLTTINRLTQDNALLNDIAKTTLETLTSTLDDNKVICLKQFLSTHPSLHHRIIILWLIQNDVQFPVTQAFLDEIIRFFSHARGGVHKVRGEWDIIKKGGFVWIVKGKS